MIRRATLSLLALLALGGVAWAADPLAGPEEDPFLMAPPRRPPAPPEPAPAPAPEPPPPPRGVPFDGVVRVKGLRDPLPGARVLVRAADGSEHEAVTGSDGRFAFAHLPPGEIVVRLSGPRLRAQRTTERLQPGYRTSVTYYLEPLDNPFQAVVRGSGVRKEVSEQILDVQEVKRIPGTQNDAVKAVQNMPGVARAPFGGGLLVVWGAAPGDTRVYADGVRIPRIFHFGGLRSTVNSEFVTELSFRPGAYSADFGRGLGGVIEIRTRTPRSDRLHGSVTLDLIDGSVTLEGPLTKKLHFAAGVRVSWISAFLPIVNRSAFQVSPFYWDYQAALRYQATPRDELELFVFGSTDVLTARVENPDPAVQVNLDSRSYFSRARLRWIHRFSPRTSLMVMPSIGGDTLRLDPGDSGLAGLALRLRAETLGYNLRAELRHRFAQELELLTGVDFEGERLALDLLAPEPAGPARAGEPMPLPQLNTASIREEGTVHLVQTAPYAIGRFMLLGNRVLISPQLRLDIDYLRSSNGEVTRTVVRAGPRLFVEVALLPERLFLKLGAGLFHRPPSGQQISSRFGNPGLDWQTGATYVLGLEARPTTTLMLQVQGFYRDLRSLVVSDPQDRFSNGGLGRVYGADFLLRQQLWRGLFGWIAYTVSRSERRDAPDQDWHVFNFDQTHILTLVASYKLPWWGLEAGVRFRYVTGNPFTPVVGGVRNLQSQIYEEIRGPRLSDRIPDFHQLDVRLDKTWTFRLWKLGLYLDIQNVYNQPNAELIVYGGRQLSQAARVTGIPIFPNLGLRADF
ncbi:MAG: TonB-dependent receptor [Myxococcales bacterium]|nr:TonB-dependent receptor [Myxococcota bacterium]MDW8281471.1 TonB-dependent receptor [Myxococcales bacterium]